MSCRLYTLLLLLLTTLPLSATQRQDGWCSVGNTPIVYAGQTAPQRVQGSFPGCTVSVYVSGTTTLATLYSDVNNTPLGNPFTADLIGHYFFYATNGRYDIKLSGAGMTAAYTQGDALLNDLLALNGANGAGALNYTNNAVNAISRNLTAKLSDTVNAADYGVVCNGATDVTALINTAIGYLVAGQTLFLPNSITGCVINSPGITINGKTNITLAGGKLVTTTVNPNWSFINIAGNVDSLTITGMNINGLSTISQPTYSNMSCGVKIPATATGKNFRFVGNQISATESGVCNVGDNFVLADITGNYIHDLSDPSHLAGRGGVMTTGWGWNVHHNSFANNPFQDIYLSGDAPPGGSFYSSATDNVTVNCGSTGFAAACITSGAYSSSLTTYGIIIARNHVYQPKSTAISSDGHLTGTLIEGNEVTGASGNVVAAHQGIIQMQGASAVGGGQTASLMIHNTVKDSTGNVPAFSITDGNANQMVGNTCQNSPSSSPAFIMDTYEGGTISQYNIFSNNIANNCGSISFQGAGPGATLNSIVTNNVLNGTIFNVDLTASSGNIVVGNNTPAARYWTAQSPVALTQLAIGGYTPSQAPTNGLAVSGQVVIGTTNAYPGAPMTVSATSGTTKFVVGDMNQSNSSGTVYQTTPSTYNWLTGGQLLSTQSYEIIASTIPGGSIFSTSLFRLNALTGDLTLPVGGLLVPGQHTSAGLLPGCFDSSGRLVKVANISTCNGTF